LREGGDSNTIERERELRLGSKREREGEREREREKWSQLICLIFAIE